MSAGETSEVRELASERRSARWWVEHFGMRELRRSWVLTGRPITLQEFIDDAVLHGVPAEQLALAQESLARRRVYDAAQVSDAAVELPWASWLGPRCRTRLRRADAGEGAMWGRCDLAPHGAEVEHALERGMVVVRWKVTVRWA